MAIFKQITERMPGGFVVYEATEEGKILYANSAAIEMFGCKSFDDFMEFVHGTFTGMVFSEDQEKTDNAIKSQIKAGEREYDHIIYRIRRKDGSLRWVDDYGHFVRTDEAGELFYVFLYDITEQRLAEEEVRRAEDALFCEKSISEAKNAFIFNLSHDLRTPLNAIMGYIHLAEAHLNEPEVVQDHLKKVRSAGNVLLALIDDLLELSTLDAKGVKVKPEFNDLAQVVESSLDMFKPEMANKHIHLVTDLEEGKTQVLIDAPRFHRAMANILSNACKFTPADGEISCSIARGESTESGYVRFEISVHDTGIGMAPEFLQRAFLPFEREQSSTKSGQIGTGIGLTVTKRIMDILGGSVSGTSEKGKGSTFVLSLPLKLAKNEVVHAPKEENAPSTPRGKGRILLVEDIEINRMMAEAILMEFGFEVESVADGCDAVDAVSRSSEGYYNAILMDIQMPVMNGYEATRAIRALDRKDVQKLPIIALSANSRPEDRAMSFESGMNAHVAKPFDVDGLIATINKYAFGR